MHERTADSSRADISSIHYNSVVSSWNCWPRWIQLDWHALTLVLQYYVPSLSRLPGRKLTDQERARVLEFQDSIHYSPRYSDDNYEYRHVMLPKAMLKVIPSDYFNSEVGTLRILTEDEWRGLGITQSLGWEHYECHAPEPHILL